ncbi:hypothetical protein [Arthrobacter sp. 92]|uniref:hypothetical protein n=1 Tax=Arthrobacter sp. 92 TaxID=3418175 RepID=UPI003D01E6DB
MTELNTYPETDSDRTEVRWPPVTEDLDGASQAGAAGALHRDASVGALVGRLGAVPGLPVAEHAVAYSDLHDALLDALNEVPPTTSGVA